jgi:5-methylcytosine-specific restriction enzyme subunit McrC
MTEPLTLTDGATVGEHPALSRLADALRATSHAAHVAGVGASTTQAPLLEAAHTGWALGRYAGRLTLDGGSVVIEPRIGWETLDGWVMAATGLRVPAVSNGGARAHVSALASMLWVRAIDGASRHGPPAFRRDVPYVGANIRGHLDVRKTVRLRAKGASSAASVYRARELDNPVTRIIVAADRVLMRQLREGRWRTDRVDAVLAQLQTAVGRRSRAPGEGELHRMRYTPITRPFKWAAELSLRIVQQDPVATTALSGRAQGLVLALDDIYGEAALNWARDARPDLRAERHDSGQIVLRDGQEIRALLDLVPGAYGHGAPVLALSGRARVEQTLELGPDAGEAAIALRRALAAV